MAYLRSQEIGEYIRRIAKEFRKRLEMTCKHSRLIGHTRRIAKELRCSREDWLFDTQVKKTTFGLR